jgi:hypothetical protein
MKSTSARSPSGRWREAERRRGVSDNIVVRAITAVEEFGVLTKVGESKRDRVFCDRAILDILEETARLVPEPPATKRRAARA